MACNNKKNNFNDDNDFTLEGELLLHTHYIFIVYSFACMRVIS